MEPVSTVALPRWVVGLLGGACVVCLVAVAFLLGRVTAPARPAAAIAAEATGQSTPAEVSVSSRVPPAEAPDDGEATRAGPASTPPAGAGPPAGGAPDTAAVATYFRQMDAVAAEAKASQDPQALARTVLEQAMSGNMGGIEGMIAGQRSLETRLGQVLPPAACREHHQRSVRLFARAIVLLERTRDAMTGQGASDLGSVAAESRAIEQEARAVDALANDLRRAAGLPPAS